MAGKTDNFTLNSLEARILLSGDASCALAAEAPLLMSEEVAMEMPAQGADQAIMSENGTEFQDDLFPDTDLQSSEQEAEGDHFAGVTDSSISVSSSESANTTTEGQTRNRSGQVSRATNVLGMLDTDLRRELSSTQIENDVKSEIESLLNDASSWLTNAIGGTGVFTQRLPLLDQSLGKLFDLDGIVKDALFDKNKGIGQAILDNINNEDTADFASDIGRLVGSISPDITPTVNNSRTVAGIFGSEDNPNSSADQLLFNANVTLDHNQTLSASLAGLDKLEGVHFQDLELDIAMALTVDVLFGYDMKSGLADNEQTFLRVNAFDGTASLSAQSLTGGVSIGMLDAAVNNGSLDLQGNVSVTLNDPDNDNVAQVTRKELANTSPSTLFSVSGLASLNGSFPVSASLGDYTTATDAAFSVNSNDLLTQAPQVSLASLDDVFSFTNGDVNGLYSMLKTFANSLSDFADSDAFDIKLPFAQSSVLGEIADFGAAITSGLIEPLTETVDIEDDSGNSVTVQRPTFNNVQQLGEQLANVLGVDISDIAPSFNANTSELTYRLDFSEGLETVEEPFAFEADAGALGELSSGGDVSLTATIEGDLILGVSLAPIQAVLTGSNDVAVSNGQLSNDAEFDLTVGGENAISVTVKAGDTSDNSSLTDLVTDFNNAFRTAGIERKVEARLDGQKLAIATITTQVAPSLLLNVSSGNPIMSDLFFSDGQKASDALSDHAFIEEASLSAQVKATAKDVQATARFGFIGAATPSQASADIDGDGQPDTLKGLFATIDAMASVGLVNPNTGQQDGRITFPQLYNAVSSGQPQKLFTDSSNNNLLTLKSSSSATPFAKAIIPLQMSPNLLGEDHPDNPVLTLDWTDILDPNTISLEFNEDMKRFRDFEGMDAGMIITVLNNVADFLTNNLAAAPALTTDLPLIDKSISELLAFAEDFSDRVKQVTKESAETLDQLEGALEDKLGLPNSALTLSFKNDLLRLDLDVLAEAFGDNDTYALDFDLAEAISNAGGNSQLEVPGGSDLVDVDAEAEFDLDAKSELNLSFGLDLSSPTNPTPVLFDNTGASLSVMANGQNINASLSLGALGLFIKNGSFGLDNGTEGQSATFGVELADAASTDLPEGAYAFTGTNGITINDINVVCDGEAHASLPVAFPTDSNELSPALALNVGDICDPVNTTTLNGPDLAAEVSNFSLADNMGAIIDGVDLLLQNIQNALNSEVFSQNFPLIGDQLQDAADFVNDIRTNVVGKLKSLTNQGAQDVKQAMFDALGPNGIDFLGDLNNDSSITVDDISISPSNPGPGTGEITFSLKLAPTVNIIDTGLDFDIGIPALNLDVDAQVDGELGFTLPLTIGVSRSDGVFFDTSVNNELQAGLTVTTPGLSATGTLGFLQVDVSDRSNDPTELGLGFSMDLKDPNSNDGRLTFQELTQGAGAGQIISASFGGHGGVTGADINLDLSATFAGDANFPSLTSGLDVDWQFSQGSFGKPEVKLTDVTLNAGEFVNDFIGPILDEVQQITQPLQPLIDVLNTEVPIVNQTLVEMFSSALPGIKLDPAVTGFLDALDGITSLVNSLPTVDNNLVLEFGTLSFGSGQNGVDLSDPDADFSLDNALHSAPNSSPLAQFTNISQDVDDFFSSSKDVGGTNTGISFPIIENPTRAFQILMGKDVDLVTYDLPALDVGFEFNVPLPPVPAGPVSVRFELGGGITASANLGFGYDTSGFRLFSQTGQAADIFNGFFVFDRVGGTADGEDINEAELTGRITAGAAVGVGVVDVGIRGGLEATLGADLRDPDGDGEVHVNEFVQSAEQGLACTFNLNGTVDMIIDVIVGAFGGTVQGDFNIVDVTLGEFGLGGKPCFEDRFEPNNTMAGATDLGAAPGIHVKGGAITTSSDRDWFRFELPQQESIDVKSIFDHSHGDLTLELYDTDRNLIKRSATTNDNETITAKDLSAGEYFAVVTGYERNDYQLAVEPAGSSSTSVYYVNRNTDSNWNNQDNQGFYTFAPGSDQNAGISHTAPKATLSSLLNSHNLTENDVVVLETGDYTEQLTIADGDGGGSWYGSVAGSTLQASSGPTVKLDGSDKSLLYGLTIGGDTGVAISSNATSNTLRRLDLTANTGVRLSDTASSNTIDNNIFTSSTGVSLTHANSQSPADNRIINNTFDTVTDGIILDVPKAQTIKSNIFVNADRAVVAKGNTSGIIDQNNIDNAHTAGFDLLAGSGVVIQGNEINNAAIGIRNDSFRTELRNNTFNSNDTALTGMGHLGAPTASAANLIDGGGVGINIPKGGDGQLIANNTIKNTGTGIKDNRQGGEFATRMPLLFPGNTIDPQALPPDMKHVTAGTNISTEAGILALPITAFTADNAELEQDIQAFMQTSQSFETQYPTDDPTIPAKVFYADALYPNSGDAISLGSRFFGISASRFFDNKTFSANVTDQLPEYPSDQPLRVEDVTVFLDTQYFDKQPRILIPSNYYFDTATVTLSNNAVRGLRPAMLFGNKISNNDVGINTSSAIGKADWTAPNVITQNNTGILAGRRAEIRYNRLLDNQVAIKGQSGALIHHNIIRSDTTPESNGIIAGSGNGEFDDAIEITNNTIHQRAVDGAGFKLIGRPTHVKITNNIIMATAGHSMSVAFNEHAFVNVFESDYNNLYASNNGHLVKWNRTFDDLLTWRIQSGFDQHSIGLTTPNPNLDAPQFVDTAGGNYHLSNNATSIDAGAPDMDAREEGENGDNRINLGAYGNTSEATDSGSSYLRLDSPRLYTDWSPQQVYLIEWSGYNVSGTVEIDILDKQTQAVVTHVATVDMAQGRYGFAPEQIDLPRDSKQHYQIRLRSSQDNSISDIMPEWFVVPDETDAFYVDNDSNANDQYTPNATGDPRNPGTSADAPKDSLFGLLDGGRTQLERIDSPEGIAFIEARDYAFGFHKRTTADHTPRLTGWVDNPDAVISIEVAGQGPLTTINTRDFATAAGGNNATNTWFLPSEKLTPIAAGTYDVTLHTGDGETRTITDALTVENSDEFLTVDHVATSDASPTISGTIQDPSWLVGIHVGALELTPANVAADGSWTLPGERIGRTNRDLFLVQAKPRGGPALEPGHNVYVDAGEYNLLRTPLIDLRSNGIHLQGTGETKGNGASILNRDYSRRVESRDHDQFEGGTFRATLEVASADNVSVEGFTMLRAATLLQGRSDARNLHVKNNQFLIDNVPNLSHFTHNAVELEGINNLVKGNTVEPAEFGERISSAGNGAIYVTGRGTLITENTVRNIGDTGIEGINNGGIRIIGNEVYGTDVGIDATSTDLLVKDNIVHDVKETGIYSNDAQIMNNTVYNAPLGIDGAVNSQVHDNLVYNGDMGIRMESGEAINNRVYNQLEAGFRVQAGNFFLLRQNHVYGSKVGLDIDGAFESDYTGDPATIRTNLVYNNEQLAIRLATDKAPILFANNTIHFNQGKGILVTESVKAHLYNNIIAGQGNPLLTVESSATSRFQADHNIYYMQNNNLLGKWDGQNQVTLSDWQNASGADAKSLNDDPLFADPDGDNDTLGFDFVREADFGQDDDFGIKSGSSAIDYGQTLVSTRTDFLNRARTDISGVPNAGPADRYAITDLGSQSFDADSGTVVTMTSSDDAIVEDLPFTFRFYDTDYNKVSISSNGFLVFDTNGDSFTPAEGASDSLNSVHNLAAHTQIAPLFDDLNIKQPASFGTIEQPTVYVDTQTSGEFTVRWQGTHEKTDKEINVAVTLFSDNTFRFDYGSGNTQLSPTVGVSAGTGHVLTLSDHNGKNTLTNAASLRFEKNSGFVDVGAIEFDAPQAAVLAPSVSVDDLTTKSPFPDQLSGKVDNPRVRLSVKIEGLPTLWPRDTGSVHGDKSWTLDNRQFAHALAPGVYDVKVTAIFGTDTRAIDTTHGELVIRTKAPRVTVDRLLTSAPYPTITGTIGDPEAQVTATTASAQLQVPDDTTGTLGNMNNGDGTWTAVVSSSFLSSPLEIGVHDISVSAVDNAENRSTDYSTNEVVRSEPLSGLTIASLTTQDSTPQLQGDVPSNVSKLNVYVSQQGPFTANIAPDGTWSVADNTLQALTNGIHDVVLIARDSNGEVLGADGTTNELTVEKPLPKLTVNTKTTFDQTPRLSGEIASSDAKVFVQIGSQIPVLARNRGDGSWTLAGDQLKPLSQGAHTVTLSAITANNRLVSTRHAGALRIGPTTTSSISTGKGWTFVDLAAVPLKHLDEVLLNVTERRIWQWNGQRYTVVTGNPDPTRGIWIYTDQATQPISFQGHKYQSEQRILTRGWNAIGSGLQPGETAPIPNQQGIHSVFEWNSSQQTYKQLNATDQLKAGNAYWVFSTIDGIRVNISANTTNNTSTRSSNRFYSSEYQTQIQYRLSNMIKTEISPTTTEPELAPYTTILGIFEEETEEKSPYLDPVPLVLTN